MSSMGEFASLNSYFEFETSVRLKARFVHDERTRKFLEVVKETSTSRLKPLRKGQRLFRAQRDFRIMSENVGTEDAVVVEEVETACGRERMVPKAEFVGDGRVNASRIPCLYLAMNHNTAMAEVRPWVGSRISLALFKLSRDCRVVDCSLDQNRSWEFHIVTEDATAPPAEPSAADKEKGVWGDIAYAFSEPVSADEPHSDYIPTQVLGEAFRQYGYDGIMYKSLLDKHGINIALFDLTAAEFVTCCLFATKSISFEFAQQEGNVLISNALALPR